MNLEMSLPNLSVMAAVELENERFILCSTLFEWFLGLRRLTFSSSSSRLIRSMSRYLRFLLRVLEATKVASILLKAVEAVLRADIVLF